MALALAHGSEPCAGPTLGGRKGGRRGWRGSIRWRGPPALGRGVPGTSLPGRRGRRATLFRLRHVSRWLVGARESGLIAEGTCAGNKGNTWMTFESIPVVSGSSFKSTPFSAPDHHASTYNTVLGGSNTVPRGWASQLRVTEYSYLSRYSVHGGGPGRLPQRVPGCSCPAPRIGSLGPKHDSSCAFPHYHLHFPRREAGGLAAASYSVPDTAQAVPCGGPQCTALGIGSCSLPRPRCWCALGLGSWRPPGSS